MAFPRRGWRVSAWPQATRSPTSGPTRSVTTASPPAWSPWTATVTARTSSTLPSRICARAPARSTMHPMPASPDPPITAGPGRRLTSRCSPIIGSRRPSSSTTDRARSTLGFWVPAEPTTSTPTGWTTTGGTRLPTASRIRQGSTSPACRRRASRSARRGSSSRAPKPTASLAGASTWTGGCRCCTTSGECIRPSWEKASAT